MKRIFPYIALVLALAEVLLILLSWFLSAALPNSGVRSILSGEGIRWFMGHFSDMLATPVLVWIVLLAMAFGSFSQCGICKSSEGGSQTKSYRERRALLISGVTLAMCVIVMLLLTVAPHAILLSATGSLFPSPFLASLLPVIAFSVCASSIIYGVIAGTYNSLSAVYESLLYGIRWAAPCLLFYILLIQFCDSLMFVFG